MTHKERRELWSIIRLQRKRREQLCRSEASYAAQRGKRPRGICSGCGREMALTLDGKFPYSHLPCFRSYNADNWPLAIPLNEADANIPDPLTALKMMVAGYSVAESKAREAIALAEASA